MLVQIYEIQTPQEAERCIEIGVDHIGSVLLSEEICGQPTLKDTIQVSKGTHARSSLIVLSDSEKILFKALDQYRPDFVHLCESLVEGKDQVMDLGKYISVQARVKEKFPEMGIIRSIPIPERGSTGTIPTLRIAEELEPVSDYFLIDTWLPEGPVEGYVGITGRTCDWKVARALVLNSRIGVILAGGLSPGNVYDALLEVRPAGADSCTHTNRVDGAGNPVRFQKDFDKVRGFVLEVRRFEREWLEQEAKALLFQK